MPRQILGRGAGDEGVLAEWLGLKIRNLQVPQSQYNIESFFDDIDLHVIELDVDGDVREARLELTQRREHDPSAHDRWNTDPQTPSGRALHQIQFPLRLTEVSKHLRNVPV